MGYLQYHPGGHADVVELLLKEDINVNLKNKDGKKPLELAKTALVGALLSNFSSMGNASYLADDASDDE